MPCRALPCILWWLASFRMPFGIPGGLVALLFGTITAWVLHHVVSSDSALYFSPEHVFLDQLESFWWPSLPTPTFARIWQGLTSTHLLSHSSVIISIAVVGTVTNLAMIDLAAMMGDR